MCRDKQHGGRRCDANPPRRRALDATRRRVARLQSELEDASTTDSRKLVLKDRLESALLAAQELRLNDTFSDLNLPTHMVFDGNGFHAEYSIRTELKSNFDATRFKKVLNRESPQAADYWRDHYSDEEIAEMSEYDIEDMGRDQGPMSKPRGGLWFSPVDENTGRSEWDRFYNGELMLPSETISHDIVFSPDASVVVVDSLEDYQAIIKAYHREASYHTFEGEEFITRHRPGLDYEKLPADAIFFTQKAINECSVFAHDSTPEQEMLLAWDLPSGIVLKTDKVSITSREQIS